MRNGFILSIFEQPYLLSVTREDMKTKIKAEIALTVFFKKKKPKFLDIEVGVHPVTKYYIQKVICLIDFPPEMTHRNLKSSMS